MKSLLTVALFASLSLLVACGPSAEEQAKLQATADSLAKDSIAKVEQIRLDSIAAVKQASLDSIALVVEKAKADSIAAAEAGKKKK